MRTTGILCTLLAGLAFGETVSLSRPYGLAFDAAGHLLVACRGTNSVVVMSRAGGKLREFGGGRLANPGGLCVLPDARVAVANTGRNEVALFAADGSFLRAVGGFAAPEDVAAGPEGRLYVADTGASRIAVLDEKLEAVAFGVAEAGEPAMKLNAPAGVAAAGGMLAVADTGNSRILLLPLPLPPDLPKVPNLREVTAIAVEGGSPRALAFGQGGRLYAVCGQEVRGFDPRGRQFGSFTAGLIRVTISVVFRPGGLALDAGGNVAVVDQHTARVFITNRALLTPSPELRLDPRDPTAAVLEWQSPSPQPTLVDYGKTDDYGLQLSDPKPTTRHRAVLRGLEPSTRYCYRIRRPFEMVPETSTPAPGFSLRHQKKHHRRLFEGNVSRNYTFATLPEAGKADWASLPTLVLVYRNVRFPAGADGKQPPNRVLDEADMVTLKNEMETYRLWAWRQSGCKLNLDFTHVVVDDERDHAVLGDRSRTVLDDALRGVTAQGKDLHAFWNVLVVGTHGWYAHYLDGPVAGTEYELGACFCGFGHGQKPGWWWFPVHEHGHLIHSIFMNSEIETFAFPDAPWTMPGQFGEDFSFMAANYRLQPRRSWLTLRTSVIQTSADANGNGVPDDDPRVPLDEKRFGWTPALGGDCLTRLMAGVRTPGCPGGTDTDFEGKVHKLNEGELHWINRRVPRGKITLDGKLAQGEWQELYSLPNLTTPKAQRGLKARLFVAWDAGRYYFAIQSDKPVIAGFDLDGANDGWFHGRDNLRFSIRPPMAGRKLEASGAIWDFLGNKINLHNGQHWYREAYKPGEIQAAVGEQDGWHVIECAVPARPDIGIAPGRRARFGLRAYLWWDQPDAPIPQTSFLDGEAFVYDLECTSPWPW